MPKISELSEFAAPEAGALIPATKSDSTGSMKLSAFQVGDLASNWGLSAAWQNTYATVKATSAAWGTGVGGWQVGGTNVTLATSTNKVGIGTTTPSEKLSLTDGQIYLGHSSTNQFESGRIRFSELNGGDYLGAYIHYDGSSSTGGTLHIGMHDSHDETVGNDVNAISIPRNTRRVGMGTTAPGALLHLVGGDIWVTAGGGSDNASLLLGDVTSSNGSAKLTYSTGTSGLWFKTGGTYNMVIDPTGNVGIGTTSPQYKLHVVGDIFSSGTTYTGDSNSNRWGSTHTTVNATSAKWQANQDDVTNLANASGNWDSTHTTVNSNSSRWSELEGDLTNVANTSANWDSAYAQVGDSTTDLNIDSGVLFVDKSANKVGIGTTEPATELTVAGSISARDNLYIGGTAFLSAGSTIGEMYFGNDDYDTHVFTGNVGIGTNNPEGDLSINHSLSSEVVVTFLADETNTEVKSNSKIKALGSATGTGGTLQFFTKPDGEDYTVAPQILIEPTGSIGIGKSTVTTGYKLDVAGDIYSDGIIYTAGTSGSNLYSLVLRRSGYELDSVDIYDNAGRGIVLGGDETETTLTIITGGKVGIGTTSPSEPLHVYGGGDPTVLVEDSTNNCKGILKVKDDNVVIGSESNHILHLATNNTNQVTIDTTGKVGIGRTPSLGTGFLLEVEGAICAKGGTVSLAGFTFNEDSDTGMFNPAANELCFYTDTERMRIDSDGNVGIGTLTPGYSLDVIGNIRVGDGTIQPSLGYSTGDSAGTVGTLSNHPFEIRTNGSEKVRITTTGKVGIGVTSPNYALDVDSSGAVASIAGREGFVISNRSTAANYYAYRGIGPHTNAVEVVGIRNDGILQVGTTNSGGISAIDFRCTNAGSLMYVASGGNVGVNTMYPTEKLHVEGGNIKLGSQSTNESYIAIQTDGSDTHLVGKGNLFNISDSSNLSRMSVNVLTGKVGIGTTGPTEMLHVSGGNIVIERADGTYPTLIFDSNQSGGHQYNLAAGSGFDISDVTAGATRLFVDFAGNIGIGTNSPSYKLDVTGDVRAKNTSSADTSITIDATNAAYVQFKQAGTQRWGLINNYITGNTFTVWDYGAATSRMALTTAGLVGINDNVPSATLDIKYDGSSNSVFNTQATDGNRLVRILQSGTNTAALLLYHNGVVMSDLRASGDSYHTGGNFGIGTDSPADKLHIHNGSVRITNDGNNPHILLGDTIVGGNYSAIRHDSTSDDLRLETNETTRVAIKEDGKVGIGTTTPNETLTVVGNVSATGTVFGANVIEIGMILPYAGPSAPAGYYLCNGAEKSRTDAVSKPLFDLIGTTYGTGNDVDTYNLPDLTGRVPIGAGSGVGLTSRTLGTEGGTDDLTAGATDAAGAFTVINYIIKY